VLGVAAALGIDLLDTTITNQEQVEGWLGLTFLGLIPATEKLPDGSNDDLMVYHQPKSVVAEFCRAIRTNLLFMSPDKPLRTILVTSSGPQDGKTTSAINVASAMAESGSRVLLVDADMRRPRVHKAFGVNNGVGLSSLILGEGQLSDAIKQTEVPNLSVLTCGPVPPNPAELLHTKRFEEIFEQLSKQYDRVIFDSPPIGIVSDGVVLSTKVDGTLLVLRSAKTSRDQAMRILRMLRSVNARIFGAVVNNVDLKAHAFGYYDYQRYGTYGETRENIAS
jgi:polysaccharide biosynthesis transport protein